MTFKESLARSRNWLFRWSTLLPLVLMVLLIPAFRNINYVRNNHSLDLLWEMMCLAISLLGLIIRVFTIGYIPKRLSGQNTTCQHAAVLNTTGMYSIVRHPLYLGNFIIWFGLSLFLGLWWFTGLVNLIFCLFCKAIVLHEEKFLEEKFGEQFLQWAHRTPAFFPRFNNWIKPTLPFSFKAALAREYPTFFAIIASFTFSEIVGDRFIEGKWEFDINWFVIFTIGLITYSSLRILKKYTLLLNGNGSYADVMREDEDFYWGEVPHEIMQQICQDAGVVGWKRALELNLRDNYKNIYSYAIRQNRADWRLLIDLSKNSTVLDIGAGWGSISSLLADHAKDIYALEVVKERVDFINIRRIQDEQLNIFPVRADFINPPFSNNRFDLIICNGVLEWVGLSDLSKTPREAQLSFLKKMFDLLKPNGVLYVGIENRFSFSSFLGAIDHSGLPYTNLLPRKIADLVVRVNSVGQFRRKAFFYNPKYSYRTYTYSFLGYRKILKEVGFKDIKIFYAIPSYNSPKTIIPIDDIELYLFYLRNMRSYPASKPKRVLRRLFDILTYVNMQKFLEDAFSIMAKK